MDKQTIGFDRELSLSWLDLTAGLAQAGLDLSSIRTKLMSQLANDVPGVEACRKTVTLLTRLWVRVPAEHQALQDEALTLLPAILPEERLWLHWGISLLAYPFFHDVPVLWAIYSACKASLTRSRCASARVNGGANKQLLTGTLVY